ncbi:hypothetical protein AQUCO_02200087v1 [Aquilegia coerulea]|uniref:Uncharacterized protein n=1 Tax=Aquilegia coerulea TaxID=218851 RepID=A0A2G5DD21_AQUCA|nr:hypothetical protein AQUCO_02200087v1 [Aquilegia coerulea]
MQVVHYKLSSVRKLGYECPDPFAPTNSTCFEQRPFVGVGVTSCRLFTSKIGIVWDARCICLPALILRECHKKMPKL